MSKHTLEELEKLASEFIIDYIPMTEEEKQIWLRIQELSGDIRGLYSDIQVKKRAIKGLEIRLWRLRQ